MFVFTLLSCLLVTKAEYYRFDGKNNNLQHPSWGSKQIPYKRLPDEYKYVTYTDETGSIDTSLPSPRKISNSLGQIPMQQSKYSKFAPLSGMAWYLS